MFRAGRQVVAAAVLLVLLATLAVLQYRWLGEVSTAERERMRASLQTRVSEFVAAFNGELTRTYLAFQVDGEQLTDSPGVTLAGAYQRWHQSAAVPGLVGAVYLLARGPDGGETLQRLDPARRAVVPAAWPQELQAWRDAGDRLKPVSGVSLPTFREPFDADVPALMVTIPRLRVVEKGRLSLAASELPIPGTVVIVMLDRGEMVRHLLEPLVGRYFGEPSQTDYLVSIVDRHQTAAPIYQSDSAGAVESATAEVRAGLFELRIDELQRLAALPPRESRDHVAFTIVRRAAGGGRPPAMWLGAGGESAWELRVQYRAGPLDAIVARSRRRNLAVSLGVLGLLGASVALVVAGARRQQRLSQQQLEFVAAVSHELRTPLAVICSAADNLADGITSDAGNVRNYGALIKTEGARLAAMVERVMAFAGMSSGSAVFARTPVDVLSVIDDAVRQLQRESSDRGVTVSVQPGDVQACVSGDRDALRSAMQNILGNAVKYSAPGGTVRVSCRADAFLLRIQVTDEGLGIDAADIAHVFQPFFRGRRALDAQVRGSGIGLSVVRHIVDAHHGSVAVSSVEGQGTTVTLELPLAEFVNPAASSAPEPA